MLRTGLIAFQHSLEIAEVFWRPRFYEIGGAGAGFFALVLVIEPACNRMVGIVDLVDEIGDRQLQLMGPQPTRLIGWCQAVMSAEIEQNISSLPNQQLPGFEK